MRIASLSPAVTEILYGMGKERDIVCTDWYSDYPEAAKSLARLKEHQKIKPEELRAFQPEIVFTSTLVQEKLAAKLKKEGFTVIHQDPRSIPEIYESIHQIGMLLGCDARANALSDSMRQGFNEVKRKTGFFPRKARIYIEEWHNPPMVSGNWVPEIVRIAGGNPLEIENGKWKMENEARRGILPAEQGMLASAKPGGEAGLPAGKNPPSREVSLEEIRTFDPDLIVLSICGAGPSASKELLTKRPGWSDLRAVRENHLFVIDDSLLNRPGPRLPEGAMRLFGWMFQVLH